MKVTLTQTIEFTDERLKDLLCSALEGGSNYWYIIRKYWNPENKEVKYKGIDLPFIEDCGIHIVDQFGDHDPMQVPMLNRETIQKGLNTVAKKYPKHLETFWTENDDAETGDVFLQCCLFGEIVYG